MLQFELPISIPVLCAIIFLSAYTGFLFRSRQIRKKNSKINQLEKEVMEAHAEILETQKEYCELESRIKDLKIPIPVIPLKHSAGDGAPLDSQEQDSAALRKKRSNRTA
jgi:hypothetical protein